MEILLNEFNSQLKPTAFGIVSGDWWLIERKFTSQCLRALLIFHFNVLTTTKLRKFKVMENNLISGYSKYGANIAHGRKIISL